MPRGYYNTKQATEYNACTQNDKFAGLHASNTDSDVTRYKAPLSCSVLQNSVGNWFFSTGFYSNIQHICVYSAYTIFPITDNLHAITTTFIQKWIRDYKYFVLFYRELHFCTTFFLTYANEWKKINVFFFSKWIYIKFYELSVSTANLRQSSVTCKVYNTSRFIGIYLFVSLEFGLFVFSFVFCVFFQISECMFFSAIWWLLKNWIIHF